MIRTEVAKRGVSYGGPSARLASLGLHDHPVDLRNKMIRGKFTNASMLPRMEALGRKGVSMAVPEER